MKSGGESRWLPLEEVRHRFCRSFSDSSRRKNDALCPRLLFVSCSSSDVQDFHLIWLKCHHIFLNNNSEDEHMSKYTDQASSIGQEASWCCSNFKSHWFARKDFCAPNALSEVSWPGYWHSHLSVRNISWCRLCLLTQRSESSFQSRRLVDFSQKLHRFRWSSKPNNPHDHNTQGLQPSTCFCLLCASIWKLLVKFNCVMRESTNGHCSFSNLELKLHLLRPVRSVTTMLLGNAQEWAELNQCAANISIMKWVESCKRPDDGEVCMVGRTEDGLGEHAPHHSESRDHKASHKLHTCQVCITALLQCLITHQISWKPPLHSFLLANALM